MFFFNKKTISSSGLFNGMTDNHSHILPSVDDGVQSMEQSLRILSEYERLGVSKVWLRVEGCIQRSDNTNACS